jgi:glyoxylase-like metal-dependent hydrolase (beta-lactamase superfamily II)
MWNLNVKVIKVGTCTIDSGNMASPAQAKLKHQLGINGGSTVTVIREGSEVLLVDTGFEREQDLSPKNRERNLQILKTHLRWAGLETKDITKVFITHFHQDHIGGIE